MGDYTRLYNKSDVVIPADVIDNFRYGCLKTMVCTQPGTYRYALMTGVKQQLIYMKDYNEKYTQAI